MGAETVKPDHARPKREEQELDHAGFRGEVDALELPRLCEGEAEPRCTRSSAANRGLMCAKEKVKKVGPEHEVNRVNGVEPR